MEKLIELLNEYNKEKGKPKRMSEREVRHHYSWIICSGYGFIKRLVDSDKIDERKLDEYRGNDYDHFNRIETLIQILSIQDDPIDLLCKLLK